MSKFYSKSTNGFYDEDLHGTAVPTDAVKITEDTYHSIMIGQAKGKTLTSDKDGQPVLSAPVSQADKPAITDGRDQQRYLASTDWYVLRLVETAQAIPPDVVAKRKAARDAISTINQQKPGNRPNA